ncbi:Purine nucleoside phosphorylase 1 [Symmachiella macrocystis]|uniref:Purine nucleoside phosphorylase n=1 Tax=Symmachiella macrocystis TaxID=2527985 RepID=A0A5C6BSW1_9PLAN|nr:purine-nucleoside phosphorylase [Symmachiella macrocystis]TWU14296.1 Purine nucleoside phosphorylase 1 [Symmachiella macrocystis]
MSEQLEQIQQATKAVRERFATKPRVGLILGTGLAGLAAEIDEQATIPYHEIPHFPESTVESHTGQLVCGTLSGLPIVAMEGRFHFYEGYSMREVTFPVRVMQELGVEILLVTNAAGGMNPQHNLGDLVVIEDHINFMGDNPLIGRNDESLGPRFPDLCAPYDRDLIALVETSALELGIRAHRGVFVAVAGPNLETRAEYRMLRSWGADLVGMSTVPEVIVAAHAGLRVLAISIVTDVCLPDALEPVDIAAIIKVAGEGGERLAKVIPDVLTRLAAIE